MRSTLLLSSALALSSVIGAQSMYVLPSSANNAEGNSNNVFPWGRDNMRAQHCYDSSNVPSTGPILIQGLRIRADGSTTSTWSGGSIANVVIQMSTAPVDYMAMTSTFANNHGKDVTTVYSGNVTVAPSPVGGGSVPQKGYYITIPLQTSFLYDPSAGDLVIDVARGAITGVQFRSDAVSGTGTPATRIYNTSSATATTGTVGTEYGIVCAIDYVPAKGLYAGFSATPVEGKSPLQVQFTDKSYSSDAGGVKTWAWDFDGDKKIDSTLQNPMHTFTAPGFDTYFDVSLTVTDATHPSSMLTRPKFIRVNPSTAKAEDFGKGTFNKAAPAPIDVSPFSSIYSSSAAIRGFYFTAPTNFVITGFETPNDYSPPESDQTIICYVMKTAPTGAYAAQPADVKFFATGKANQILPASPPIVVQQGDWVGVLGACHASAASSSLRNSYGAGSFSSTVLGQPITLNRLWMNADPRANKGVGTINPSTGSLARVFVHVAGNTSSQVPSLTSSARPILGTTPNLEFDGKLPTAQGGVLFLGSGRLPAPVSTPFGDLLILPPFGLTLLVPGGKGNIPLPIPNNNNLKGVVLDWQGFVFDLQSGTWGMTNGTEWYVGLQN